MTDMHAEPLADALYPPAEPYDAGWLDVGEGHRLYYEQCGMAQAPPLLYLHGGPGSGCSPRQRRLFDPTRTRMVLFDQRGCGRSKPHGEVRANTSKDLIADIERLRVHLGLRRWLVVGGSWGAGLGLAYAAEHPQACAGLVLRAPFLGRPEDIDWFFLGARDLQPAAWEALRAQAPAGTTGHPLHWLHAGLQGADPTVARRCALAWQHWEAALNAEPPAEPADASATAALIGKYRIQSHYLINGCFWGERALLERTGALHHMPVTLLHGTADVICRPEATRALHAALPHARVHWLDGCGHALFAPPMARALAQAVRDMNSLPVTEASP